MMKKIFFIVIFLGLSFKSFAVIETEDIGGINPETVGVNTYDTKFIPTDLWEGLSHTQVVRLIKNLPTKFKNNFWTRLQISLLLSPMKVPENKTGENNIFNLRFEKLLDMEAVDQAYNLGKNHADQLDEDSWAWGQFIHFLIHNNYDKAFSIAQEFALKDKDNKWQHAVITMQLLMGKDDQANLSLSLLEKENKKQDHHFIKTIKQIQTGEKIKDTEHSIHRPLIIKLMVSKNIIPEDMSIESMSDDIILMIILDPGFEKFSDRMKLSILEYYTEQNTHKPQLLKDHYLKLATEDLVKEATQKISNKEYDKENDPLIRAALYKIFVDSEGEEIKKMAFSAFYKNAYANKILTVAVACFGNDYNYPAAAYDKDYSFAFVLHNLMLKNKSQMKAWVEGLNQEELSELSLILLASCDLDYFSGETQEHLMENVKKLYLEPAKKFLFKEKLKFLHNGSSPFKLSDSRLIDVISGQYGFGAGLSILLSSSQSILSTDVWQAAVQLRVLEALKLKNQATQLRQLYAYSSAKDE